MKATATLSSSLHFTKCRRFIFRQIKIFAPLPEFYWFLCWRYCSATFSCFFDANRKGQMVYSSHDADYFELHLLWIFPRNSYCHERGQASRALTGIEIKTYSNFKTSSLSCCLLPACQYCNWFYILLVFSRLCQQRRIRCDYTFIAPLGCHAKICLKLRQDQAKVRQHVGHEQANGGGIPMNIERYKDCLHHSLGAVVVGLLLFPNVHFFDILSTVVYWYKVGSIFNVSAITVVYFNCTLNPILYYWKIRKVREAVKTTLKQISCFLSWSRLPFSDVGNIAYNNSIISGPRPQTTTNYEQYYEGELVIKS